MNFDFASTSVRSQALDAFQASRGMDRGVTAEEEGSLGFWDLVDVVNPLHHIPVVSSIYRHFSDDEISIPARLAGGFLFGGVFGLAASAANVVVELATGDDVGGHAMALVAGDDPAEAPTADLAFERARHAYERVGGGDATGYVIDTPQ